MRTAMLSLLILTAPTLAPAQPVKPPDPEYIIDRLMHPPYSSGPDRMREYQEERALVGERPELFALILRDRLMRGLPATLDEYRVDDPKWVINRPSPGNPNPPAFSLLRIVAYLGREHAEPIIAEFFQKAQALATEARRRHWQERADAESRGEKSNDRVHAAWLVWAQCTGGASKAVEAAKWLKSPVLVDPLLAMLTRDDAPERYDAASFASYYFPEIADQRPDAIVRARALAEDLAFSENPEVVEAGRRLQERLRTVAPFEEEEAQPHDPRPR